MARTRWLVQALALAVPRCFFARMSATNMPEPGSSVSNPIDLTLYLEPHEVKQEEVIPFVLPPANDGSQLKESDVRPREIPSPKDSVFLANMRSHKKVVHRLAEFGKLLREPGADSLEGVENDCTKI